MARNTVAMTATRKQSAPERQTDRDSPRVLSWALVAVCLGYFMVILDTTIVNVALPALRTDLQASVSGLQWVVDAYLLMLAALLLSGGVLADRLGARRAFQVGLAVFVAASVGCGLAPNVVVLVIARLVQGAGAAHRCRRRWRCCEPPTPTRPPELGRSGYGAGLPGSPLPPDPSWAGCWSPRRAGGWCSSSTCRSGWPRSS